MIFGVSLNAIAGPSGLFIALAASVFGAGSIVAGVRRRRTDLMVHGGRYAWVILAGAVVAFAAMERALIQRDFSLAYVQEVGSTKTPALYNLTAIWTSLEGSLLLWLLVLAGYTAAIGWRYRARRDDALVAWAMVTLYAVCAFFFMLALFPANPFAQAATLVEDGQGPNALLQNHILVVFHPPLLYLGYVGMTVPFAFAIAALVTGRVGEGWLMETRRWTLFSWAFLTIGILLGGWWSYEVLGWGGVWAWDPVENASFLPWLTGTAYLHSVLVQERRGMLRVWNLSLLVATFSLTIFGTFLTRSGVVRSVHAFSESAIGPWLLGFFGVVVFVSLGLIAWRGDRLRAPGTIDSPLSREAAFLANNVVFAVFAFVVLLGTVFPLIVEALQDRDIKVGAPFFDRLGIPIGITLLFLMSVAPVLPWRKASGELLRERLFWPAWGGVAAVAVAVIAGGGGLAPLIAFGLGGFAGGAALRQVALATRRHGWRGFVGRANGGMIVHLGVILIAVGLTASNSYTRTQSFEMAPGETVNFAGHTFTYNGSEEFDRREAFGTRAFVSIDGGQAYAPALTTFRGRGTPVPTPSVATGLDKDIYLTLDLPVPQSADEPATITVSIKPMIIWLWIGGLLMALGTILAAFPGQRRRPTDPVSAPLPTELADRDAVSAGVSDLVTQSGSRD
jgi:cytochrome c-type biogenesis protein CcmF